MSAAPTPLGIRLRALRSARGWTLARASQATGLARSTLSKIENGRMSPTYDNVLKLAAGFEVDVAELFAVPEPAPGPSVCRRGEGRPHATPLYQHALLCAERPGKRMMPFLSRVRAHADTPPDDWSRHAGEEFVYVLDGAVELHTERGDAVRLAAGDCAYLDSGTGHRLLSLGEHDAEVLWISTQPQAGEP